MCFMLRRLLRLQAVFLPRLLFLTILCSSTTGYAETLTEVMNYYSSVDVPAGCQKRMEQKTQGTTPQNTTTIYNIFMRCPAPGSYSYATITEENCDYLPASYFFPGMPYPMTCGEDAHNHWVGYSGSYECQTRTQIFDCTGNKTTDRLYTGYTCCFDGDPCSQQTTWGNCTQYDTLLRTFCVGLCCYTQDPCCGMPD